MPGELLPAVPGEGLAQLLGQPRHRRRQRGVHRDGAVAAERRTVLHGRFLAPALQPRQVHQERGSAAALDERADRGPARSDDQIAFPVPGNRAIRGLGGTFAEDDIRGDMPLRLVLRPRPRLPQRPAGAQTRDQLPLERATALDEQRLVDRLMADAHGLIIGEVDLQPVRDLFRAPRRRPPPVLPVRLVQPLPRRRLGPGDDRAVGPADAPGEPLLHVLTQPVVAHELRGLRALRRLLRLPLRHQGPVDRLAAPGRRVAAQLARDRPRVTSDPAGDLAHPELLSAQQRDLLTLGERQVAARGLVQADRRHAASVTEPAGPDRPRHTDRLRGLDRRHPRRDPPPELPLHRTRGLRPAR